MKGKIAYTKLFRVVFTVKGQTFIEFFEGNLRINAVSQAYRKGADKVIDVVEVKERRVWNDRRWNS